MTLMNKRQGCISNRRSPSGCGDTNHDSASVGVSIDRNRSDNLKYTKGGIFIIYFCES